MTRRFTPLRNKLITVTLIVQLSLLGLLAANMSRVWDRVAQESVGRRVAELNVLLNAALAPALVAQDFAAGFDLMEEMREGRQIEYLVLSDRRGKVVAASGWNTRQALPPVSTLTDIGRGGELFHVSAPVMLAGQRYGELRYGFSTGYLAESMGRLFWQTVIIALFSIIVSSTVLILFGLKLTHALTKLMHATDVVAAGEAELELDYDRNDEIGQLVDHFNGMAGALRERIAALKRSEQRFNAIANYTYGCELWVSQRGRLKWVNPAVERLTGYTPDECMNMPDFPAPLIMECDRADVLRRLRNGLDSSGQDMEFRGLRKDGSEYWGAVSWHPIYSSSGENLGIRASVRDATEIKDTQLVLSEAVIELQHAQALQQRYLDRAEAEKARLSALLGAMSIGILFVDHDERVVYHNSSFSELWGMPAGRLLIGMHFVDAMRQSGNQPEVCFLGAEHDVGRALESGHAPLELDMQDGRVIRHSYQSVTGEQGAALGRVWVFEDVTERHRTAERLAYLAERDSLTGLYNRYRFQEDLARLLADAERNKRCVGLMFFDLDEFKYVNDTFGHGAGDSMLIRVAQAISGHVRRNETLYRLGGDEFALLVPELDEQSLAPLAERLVESVGRITVAYEGQNLRMGTSVGVALFPQHASSGEELVANADMAMYQAKAAGKNTWRRFSPDQNIAREVVDRWSWSERIQHALDEGLFELHFQGIYEVSGPRLTHLEALLRMRDQNDRNKLVSPVQFIPVAEKTGKILAIDRWVIRNVVERLAANPSLPPVSVNISGRSFDDPTLPGYIAELLASHGVLPERLYVEVTETAAVSDLHDAQQFIDALRETGCHVCLDDFGAGFASFAYLKHLKADVLKIDGTFVRDITHDNDSQIFVQGIVAMAHGMGKLTVAEFVENSETLDMLRNFGVDMVQGFFLDKPQVDHPALATPAPAAPAQPAL